MLVPNKFLPDQPALLIFLMQGSERVASEELYVTGLSAGVRQDGRVSLSL